MTFLILWSVQTSETQTFILLMNPPEGFFFNQNERRISFLIVNTTVALEFPFLS